MQLSEGSRDKILHSKSRTRCFSKGEFFSFFWRFVCRSDTPKYRQSFSRLLCKDYQAKLTTLLEPLHLSMYNTDSSTQNHCRDKLPFGSEHFIFTTSVFVTFSSTRSHSCHNREGTIQFNGFPCFIKILSAVVGLLHACHYVICPYTSASQQAPVNAALRTQ